MRLGLRFYPHLHTIDLADMQLDQTCTRPHHRPTVRVFELGSYSSSSLSRTPVCESTQAVPCD